MEKSGLKGNDINISNIPEHNIQLMVFGVNKYYDVRKDVEQPIIVKYIRKSNYKYPFFAFEQGYKLINGYSGSLIFDIVGNLVGIFIAEDKDTGFGIGVYVSHIISKLYK